jgi:malate synthase
MVPSLATVHGMPSMCLIVWQLQNAEKRPLASQLPFFPSGPIPFEFRPGRIEKNMATATAKPNPASAPLPFANRIVPVNSAPQDFDAARDLPAGFLEFLAPLHAALTLRQRSFVAQRGRALADAHAGKLPNYLPPSVATTNSWRIELPAWCADQRNQMTGPADDRDLVVKMLNSGAPGVMLDLEDSNANTWEHTTLGIHNILEALAGRLTYFDRKREKTVGVLPSSTVIFTRPRGLHIHQAGVLPGELLPASLFDVAMVAYQTDFSALRHPLCFYIPKSESADEARWWRDLFQLIARAKGLPAGAIKCMALVESHPLAYQMEEFAWNLREHILGLNLGRWDYMASLTHFHLENPEWVLPDRNTIPHNVAFFQNLRELMPEICHRHGMLAIGGMTALYPSREDADLNARALKVLAEDKKNESTSLMDGAWTGHPDQNAIAVAQFPAPNQLHARPQDHDKHPNLRPVATGVGKRTLAGTRAAVRTVIRYRNGVLNGKGASLLDGYMEDLATDRIYRLMIAQRLNHSSSVEILDEGGAPLRHTPELITRLFDEELERLLGEPGNANDSQTAASLREARNLSEEMIRRSEFNPA